MREPEVVTGPYKTLRGLKDGALLKRDTQKPVTPAQRKFLAPHEAQRSQNPGQRQLS